ncbi:unnamed protein product [Psylliodes chrysocephalus]|uniref:Uncharacterized protein n=1 Tax=Psylliodes chrysocephalus TaxID=3402493 RepID=A0A9P0GDI7_9CUCU|nr:unnamed protein product [Psylliodes chrysocephala]
MEERFLKNNAEWLNTSISFQNREEIKTLKNKRDRPEISFESSSERTKRLKTKKLRDSTPNPRPASTRYCRPIKIEFIKESTEVSIMEKNRIDDQIKQLRKSTSIIQGKSLNKSHNLIFAMVDGKVCNALTATTSAQKCFICGATSKDFNRIDEMIKRKIKTENLETHV